ncbi:MAG: CPBP family intramembrane metalloprotease [Spirulinaceae cyanobacterium SM2_1_0]|nr:CPBP family intramembrane metalloprotease [Spirulinaceae cyanobacterium SM2_1_0]
MVHRLKIPWQRFQSAPIWLRLLGFLAVLAGLWLPLALPLYLWLRADANATTIAVMGVLFLNFLVLVRVWGRRVYGRSRPYVAYGLTRSVANLGDALTGLILGLVLPFALFASLSLLGWLQWQTPPANLWHVTLAGSLTGLGVGLAEELVFRGWLLDELERDYRPAIALWVNALIFAILHFIKPLAEVWRTLPQFPGLVLLALSLIWGKRARGDRLGFPIGLHSGLVWGYYIINVGDLIAPTERVSPWLTGVDGNPLAGGGGLLFLAILAFWLRRQAQRQQIDANKPPFDDSSRRGR